MGESCSKRRRTTFKDTRVTGRCWKTGVCKRTNPAQLVLCNRARVHEGLGDHREHGIHVVRCLDVEDKLGILHNIDPETQRETGETVPTVLDMTVPLSSASSGLYQTIVYLLVFQIWMVSESEMPCCAACSSNRSKKYLTASGTGRLVLRITVKRSSTNFCSVP